MTFCIVEGNEGWIFIIQWFSISESLNSLNIPMQICRYAHGVNGRMRTPNAHGARYKTFSARGARTTIDLAFATEELAEMTVQCQIAEDMDHDSDYLSH